MFKWWHKLLFFPRKRSIKSCHSCAFLSQTLDVSVAERPFSSKPAMRGNLKNQEKTDLQKFIIQKVRSTGPMSVEQYMRLCLSAPKPLGYYRSTSESGIFSEQGDFYTSPEITQVLGELIGVWIFDTISRTMGHVNKPWRLVELGPGSGELMTDLVSTLKNLQRKFSTINLPEVNLLEINEQLVAAQASRLLALPGQAHEESDLSRKIELDQIYSGSHGLDFRWFGHFNDLFPADDQDNPETTGNSVDSRFSFFLMHEYLDALPVHKFRKDSKGRWREILIDLDASGQNLSFVLAKSETYAQKAYLSEDLCSKFARFRQDLEFSPQMAVELTKISDHLNSLGGCALIFDYGSVGSDVSGDTFRAFFKHRQIDPLTKSGACDLTADVNFNFVTHILREKCAILGPVTQKDFLLAMGVKERFAVLRNKAKGETVKEYLRKCENILLSDSEMGSRFKVMAIFPKVMEQFFELVQPVGFDVK